MQFYLKSLLQQIAIVLCFIALKLFMEYNNDNNLLLIGMNTYLLFSSSALKNFFADVWRTILKLITGILSVLEEFNIFTLLYIM